MHVMKLALEYLCIAAFAAGTVYLMVWAYDISKGGW